MADVFLLAVLVFGFVAVDLAIAVPIAVVMHRRARARGSATRPLGNRVALTSLVCAAAMAAGVVVMIVVLAVRMQQDLEELARPLESLDPYPQ